MSPSGKETKRHMTDKQINKTHRIHMSATALVKINAMRNFTETRFFVYFWSHLDCLYFSRLFEYCYKNKQAY